MQKETKYNTRWFFCIVNDFDAYLEIFYRPSSLCISNNSLMLLCKHIILKRKMLWLVCIFCLTKVFVFWWNTCLGYWINQGRDEICIRNSEIIWPNGDQDNVPQNFFLFFSCDSIQFLLHWVKRLIFFWENFTGFFHIALYMFFNRRAILHNWFSQFFLFLHFFLISTKSKFNEYLKRNKMSSDKNLPI